MAFVMMKKIAYLMEYPIDLPGGAQLSTYTICKALSENKDLGYEPLVICPALLGKRSYPFRVRTFPMGDARIPNFLTRLMAFIRIINEEKPDLIHIEMAESLITYLFAGFFSPKIPYLYTDRGMYFGYRKRSLIFMLPALGRARLLVTTTLKNKRLWEENTGIRPIAVIPNTISDIFETYEDEKKKRGGRLVLGFAGRICPEKDWPLVPVLLKEIKKRGFDFEVRLVLSLFEKGDREIADGLRVEISSIVGSDNFEYYEDLTQEEMSDFYYSLDIFIMTSVFESFGKAAVEAMSRRCACLATNVGGLPEVIGKEENLYSKDSLSRAADFIERMEKDRDLLAYEQDYAFKRYRSRFTGDKYIERHEKAYEFCLRKGD